jgi:hypothetical protein
MDDTWNVRSMYRAGSLRAVAEELSQYELYLVGVQEVRWDGGGTEPSGESTFSMERGMGITNLVHRRLISILIS